MNNCVVLQQLNKTIFCDDMNFTIIWKMKQMHRLHVYCFDFCLQVGYELDNVYIMLGIMFTGMLR